MKRRKIILYRPGWISLLLLPLFCIVLLYKANENKQYCLLKVFRITKESYTTQSNNAVSFFCPPERQFRQINIGGGDRETGRKQLDTVRLLLQDIKRIQDAVRGIHFHFEKQATYGNFVQILNLCNIEGLDHFISLNNDIRAYHQGKEKLENQFSPSFFCGTVALERDLAKTRIEMERKSEQTRIFQRQLIDFWPSGLVFLLLSFLSFLPIIFKNCIWSVAYTFFMHKT